MTDEAGAAAAAAEPIATSSTGAPQAEAPAPAERSKEPARASIDRAFAALDGPEAGAMASTKEPKPAAKETKDQPVTAATGERERDESGRFRAKDAPAIELGAQLQPEAKASTDKPAAIASEPPARFSADAKAAWATAPEPVKAEVNRAFREMEQGLSQYQQVFEPLKPYFKMAQERGVEIHRALDQYVNLDTALISRDPQEKLAAINHVFDHAGISPRDFAAYILGQPADQANSQLQEQSRELQRRNIALERQLEGHTASLQATRQTETEKQVEEFAKEHTRLHEEQFAATVARVIQAGLADDLPGAYAMAERLTPEPVVDAQTAAAQAAQTKPNSDQTRKGSLSITGAPASGSNPVNRKAPATARESLDRSFASLGIG